MPFVKKEGGGRPKFEPSDTERALVRTAISGGVRHDQIWESLGIKKTAFYRIFKEEVKVGAVHMDIAMMNAVYKAGMNGNVKAMIYWLSTRRPKDWSPSYQLRHGIIGEEGEDYILEMNMGLPADKIIDAASEPADEPE